MKFTPVSEYLAVEVSILVKRLGCVAAGIHTPNLCMGVERSKRLPPRSLSKQTLTSLNVAISNVADVLLLTLLEYIYNSLQQTCGYSRCVGFTNL